MFTGSKRCFFLSLFLPVLLYIPLISWCQAANSAHIIHLKTGDIAATANAGHWADSISQDTKLNEPIQVILHFNALPIMEQRNLLQQNGVTLLDYLPVNSFIALIESPSKAGRVALYTSLIHSVINVRTEWKIESSLLQAINGKQGSVEVMVSFYPCISAAGIRQFIATVGGQVEANTMEKYGNFKIKIPAAKIHSMASWYGVKFVGIAGKPVPCDLESRPAGRGNIAVASPIFGGFGLLGDSVTVGIGDNSSGIFHADLKDRTTDFNPGPYSGHGEHVNGIVGGASIVDPLAGSMAPHVSMVDFLFDLIFPETKAMFNDYHMTITNNSYAVILGDCSYAGTYDGYAVLIDTLSLEDPYVLNVFAAGNDGLMNCSPYLPGYATVAGGYQPAKNNLVVGSYTDFLIEANDESRGPTKDGRLKPELIATGLGAYSTIGVDNYAWDAGTSMASPHVAGGLAILTQRYKQLNGNALPNTDLLKALAMNGALDLGNPGPDFSYGFGGLDVYRSLLMIDSGRYFRSFSYNGESQVFNISVPPNTGKLKVMICWNDLPASLLAATQLVNDIDLTVKEPSGNIHLPLVLDPAPANVNNNATEKPDHLNNAEQVTIYNPVAGTYTVNIKGYNIPNGVQPYALVYDIIPNGVLLTFPIGGEQLSNQYLTIGDSTRVFWDGVTDSNSFTVKFSTDSGATWSILSDSIPPGIRRCDFITPGINSGNCMVQVARNNTSQIATSGRFSINAKPVVQLDTVQCPGYINIHWLPVPNATSYYLLAKKGFYMQVVDSTNDTFYSFRNMSLTEKSYIAIQPVINGAPGYRSVAAIVIANLGNCANPVSAGDLMAEQIISPVSGRKFTSSQHTANDTLTIKLRNLYNTECTFYKLSYQVNSGAWKSDLFSIPIFADSFIIIGIPGLDLSAVGSYLITVALDNLLTTDPNPVNDTLRCTVLNIANDTINLANPFTDSFETMDVLSIIKDSIGISPNGHWDFFNANDTGRLRTFISDDITISGHRAISMDETRSVRNGSKNEFTGTFNLSNFDTATDEIRIDFDYLLSGIPASSAGNLVNFRNTDTASWVPFFAYNLANYPGIITHARSLSVTDALTAIGRNFSGSSQISFGQNDTSLIAAHNYGNGITIDNFRLYSVIKDVQMVQIISPLPTNCGLPASAPLTIQLHNGVNHTLFNVAVGYQLDSNTVYTGIIDSIKAKDTISYTFSQQMNISNGQTHTINTWANVPGDSYHANDSIMHYQFRNSPVITTFPYLENFESGDGGYFTSGYNDSWQYGTPASTLIGNAASGKKAWKTNLAGNYNNLEQSYLYSPCFDISSLNDPMLSLSVALDIENCGSQLCDEAFLEYSIDGIAWMKLGNYGEGTNWYDSTFDVWNVHSFTRWHVASISLPKPLAGSTIHFRFVFTSDPGTNYEGIAVDDIHIFDRVNSILTATTPVQISQELTGNTWTDFIYAYLVSATLQANNQNLGNTSVTQYPHDTFSNPSASQYIFPRNYAILPATNPTSNVGARLYLTDNEFVRVLNDTTCPSCTRPADVYRLGITQYQNNNLQLENGNLADDTGGIFTFTPYTSVQWVPYDQGYYAQFITPSLAEFWLNDGGPTGNFPAGTDYLNFTAIKIGQRVLLNWISLIDTAVFHYQLEKSIDGADFSITSDTASAHINPVGQYLVTDDTCFNTAATVYYRLKWTMTGRNNLYYSTIRKVNINDSANNFISFNAIQVDHKDVDVSWQSEIDGTVNSYVLERDIDNTGYAAIATIPSLKQYSHDYYYNDEPAASRYIANLTPIHYRLTAMLADGSKVVLPVRTINWINNNFLVNIYPNPVITGEITLVYNADPGTMIEMNITDLSSRVVYEAHTIASQWNNTVSFTTFRRPTGLYFVRLLIGDKVYVVKMEWQ